MRIFKVKILMEVHPNYCYSETFVEDLSGTEHLTRKAALEELILAQENPLLVGYEMWVAEYEKN